jgi:hypothetical protein
VQISVPLEIYDRKLLKVSLSDLPDRIGLPNLAGTPDDQGLASARISPFP